MGIAIAWKDQQISYSDLNQFIKSYKDFLVKPVSLNGKHGDFSKVAIFVENRPEWIYSLLGALGAKHVVISVDHMSPASDVAYILNDCRADWVICSHKTESILKDALATLPSEYKPDLLNIDVEQLTKKETIHDELKLVMDEFQLENSREALVIYTSGTTGGPKGVVLSYANILANLDAVCRGVPIFAKERPVLALLPFHHVLPLVGSIIAPLYVRSKIAMCPSLDPAELMSTLQNNKVAIMIGVPRLYAQIFRGIKAKIDLSGLAKKLYALSSCIPSLRMRRLIFTSVHKRMGGNITYLVSGGAALDFEIAKGLSVLGLEVLEGYGMTEAAPMITFPRPGKVKLGTTGQALPGIEIKLFDGEILIRGKNIMKGYYRKPEETQNSFSEGWLKTGDLGSLDDEGYLSITGRSKELIILSNGKNISPVEIEMKLEHMVHDKKLPIKELAVMAKNDLLHALFVTENMQKLEDLKKNLYAELLASYNDSVPTYKQIRSFDVLLQPLPRTRLEKLKRHELSHLLDNKEEKLEKVPQIEMFPELEFIKDFLEKEINRKISVTHSFAGDIAMDSLSRVSFFAAIKESFDYEINEETLKEHSTPLVLAQFLKTQSKSFKRSDINWKQILNESVGIHLPKTWPSFNVFKNLSYLVCKVYFRLSSEGRENIPTQGPCLFVVNHQSFLDGLLVAFYLKNRVMKQTYFYAKAKHVNSGMLRFLAATNNVIVVDKELDLKLSIQKMAEVLKMKKNIIIFPEGTRTHDGKLGDLKKTFAILSKELNIPIVPVQISGAFKALPRRKMIPKPFVRIKISFKPLIWPKNLQYEDLLRLIEEHLNSEE